jgi:hypothetical protein
MILKPIFSFLLAILISVPVYSSEDIPKTGWGAVLKVPVAEIEYVDKWLVEWGNWIKNTHPMGADEKDGLESLTITKSDEASGHVYYVIIERYHSVSGLKNHTKIFQRDVGGAYQNMFSKLYFFNKYRVSSSEQRKTLYSLIPSIN